MNRTCYQPRELWFIDFNHACVQQKEAGHMISTDSIVHPGIDAVLTYFLKKSTVWRPFDLELPNFGQVITTHGNSFDMTPNVSVKSQFF